MNRPNPTDSQKQCLDAYAIGYTYIVIRPWDSLPGRWAPVGYFNDRSRARAHARGVKGSRIFTKNAAGRWERVVKN